MIMKTKLTYETVEIKIVHLNELDVISTSGAFDGEDDAIYEW